MKVFESKYNTERRTDEGRYIHKKAEKSKMKEVEAVSRHTYAIA